MKWLQEVGLSQDNSKVDKLADKYSIDKIKQFYLHMWFEPIPSDIIEFHRHAVIVACLAGVHPNYINQFDAQEISVALKESKFAFFDRLTINYIKRCQEMRQRILDLLPEPSYYRNRYLVNIEVVLDCQCRDPKLLLAVNSFVATNLLRCANIKQIRQCLELCPKLFDKIENDVLYATSEILYHPVETMSLLTGTNPGLLQLHYSTSLERQP